jgi:hypothetical protein
LEASKESRQYMLGIPSVNPRFPPFDNGGWKGDFCQRGARGDFVGGFSKGAGCPSNVIFFESLTIDSEYADLKEGCL